MALSFGIFGNCAPRQLAKVVRTTEVNHVDIGLHFNLSLHCHESIIDPSERPAYSPEGLVRAVSLQRRKIVSNTTISSTPTFHFMHCPIRQARPHLANHPIIMAAFRTAAALFLALHTLSGAVAQGVVIERNLNAETETVTVMVTPAAPPVVVMTRTVTRAIITPSEVATVLYNCTTSVRAPAAPPATPTTPAPAPPTQAPESADNSDVMTSLVVRQDSDTATVTETVTAPAPAARTSTVLVPVVATATSTRTISRAQCVATVAVAYTLDASTTISRTQTAWETTITATSRVTCRGLGGGGGGFGGGFTSFLTVPTGGVVPTAPPETMALPTLPAEPALAGRQESGTPPPAPPTASLTPQGTIATTTVHLTSTAYTVVRQTNTGSTVAVQYACIPTVYDTVTVARTRTAWPSTVTVASTVDCRSRPPAAMTAVDGLPGAGDEAPPAEDANERRQAAPTPAPTDSDAIHRTRTVYPYVTVTEADPTTRLIYNCAPSAPATTSTTTTPAPTSSS